MRENRDRLLLRAIYGENSAIERARARWREYVGSTSRSVGQPGRSVLTPMNRSSEEQLMESVEKTCKQAYDEGVVPTHVGMHPDDIRAVHQDITRGMHEWDFVVRFPVGNHEKASDGGIRYTSLMKSVLVVADARLERNTANVVNAEGAFVAGYMEMP